jgi:tRNA pseudouridine38-40 synthase
MYYHRLIVSYKGTDYYGWQDNGTSDTKHTSKPTIEASILKVLKQICNYESCTIATASRTDAGVHAQGQTVKVSIPLDIASEKLLLGMNSLLPSDIRISKSEPCSPKFNPNKDSKSKAYHYYFCTDSVYNPVLNDSVAHIPHSDVVGSLDIALMQEACKLFVGEHDFYSFAKRDTSMPSTVRTLLSCEIVQAPSMFANEVYVIKVVGEGFLRYMVRYIAGALFALGRGQISLSDISDALVHHNDEKLSARAKSRGLHLIEVNY